MKINLDDLKDLRDRTGLGLNDCKKALEECEGDVQQAVDRLRKIGLAKADKKSGRITAEGVIAGNFSESRGVLIELNCETDFVARNDRFVELVTNVASIANEQRCSSVEELKSAKYDDTGTVQEAVMGGTSVLGERLELSNLCYLESKAGVVAGYVHGYTRNLGKIGALVALQSSGDKAKLKEVGKEIAMHIVATRPEALSIEDLDPAKINNERSIAEEQVKGLNKPEAVTKRIVDGRLAKYYEDVVLLEQRFVKDDKMKVSDFIKSRGSDIKLTDFKLLVLGNAK